MNGNPMKTFTLRIDCGNAAFEENAGAELASLLIGVAHTIHDMIRADAEGVYSGGIRDSNGNTVGKWSCEEAKL